MSVTVLGAGAWGTAVAHLLAARHRTLLWGRDAAQMVSMAHARENQRYLPGINLHPDLHYSADLQQAFQHVAQDDLRDSTQSLPALFVLATPVSALRNLCLQIKNASCRAPIVWLCKGFEVQTGLLPHEVVREVLGADYLCAALTGPSFALEAARGLPTALVAAAHDADFAHALLPIFHHAALRVYASHDVVGAEVGGAVKNVLAIASGIADGLQLGDNARAALMTRGLAEMTRLALAMGAQAETLYGLAGMGDLMLTAAGNLSRNRKVGLRLGQGQTLDVILRELGHVAEGVACARAVLARAQALKVEMPIAQAVAAVLFEDLSPKQAVLQLLAREAKKEKV